MKLDSIKLNANKYIYCDASKVNLKQNRPTIIWSFLFFGIAISGILFLFDDTILRIFGFSLLTILGLLISRFELLHPYTWYVPFIYIYSISNAILVLSKKTNDIGHLNHSLLLQWVACVILMVVIGPNIRKIKKIDIVSISNLSIITKPIFWLSFALTVVSIIYIWKNSISSKMIIALDDSIFIKFSALYPLYILSYGILLIIILTMKRKIPVLLISFVLSWLFLSFLINGDRGTFFRGLWVTIFLLHCFYKPISKTVLVSLSSASLIMVPIFSTLKNILLTGKINGTFDITNLITSIANTEFASASYNFQVLLANSNQWNFFWGETLLWDIKRAIVPSIIDRDFLNPTIWYNQSFFPNIYASGGGMGFSLVAEGYMNYGVIGIVFWFFILGNLVKYFYNKGTNSSMWLLIYILSMPIIVFATRADFSTILTQSIKQIVFPIILLFLLHKFMVKVVNKNK
jgi:oligosaccharide repeat unit polymerase